MRRPLAFVISAFVLLGSITLPASAQDFVTPKPTAACTKLGDFGINNGQLMTCQGNGGSLTWHLETNFIAGGLCSSWTPGDTSTWAELQLFLNGKWVTQALPIALTPGPLCDNTRVNSSIPWIALPTKVADGTKYRWIKGKSGNDGHGGKAYGKAYADPVFIYTKSAMTAKYLKIFRAVVSPVYGPSAYNAMMAATQMPGATPTTTPLPTPSSTASPVKAVFVPKIPITLPVPQNGTISFANAADNYAQIPQIAWQRIQDVIAANPEASIPIKITIGPNTKTTEEPILNAIKREYRLFSGFSQPPTFSGIVFGPADEKWAETKVFEVLATIGYVSSPGHDQGVLSQLRGACNIENGTATECFGGNTIPVFVKKDGTPLQDGIAIYGVQAANGYDAWTTAHQYDGAMTQVNHEFTHAMQYAQFIGVPLKSNEGDRSAQAHHASPCWFSEGQANGIGIGVFQNSLNAYLAVRDYTVTRPINPGTTVSLNDFSAAGFTNFLTRQDPQVCYNPSVNPDWQLGYSVGMAATEALIAIGGPQATMALLAKGTEGLSWNEAFQAVYGIPWSQGAEALGKVLAAEYAAKPPKK